MIPSSPLKKEDFFQITNLQNKKDVFELKPSSDIFITRHSAKQFIVFICFFIVVMISSFLQTNVLNSSRSNEYVKNFYGQYTLNQYNLLSEIENTSKFLVKSLYFLNRNKLNLTNEISYIPITDLRIRVRKICYNNDINCENKAPFNTIANNTYLHNPEAKEFLKFISIFQANLTLEIYLKTIDQLIIENFFAGDTKEIKFDVSFYNPTTNMITYSELTYTISPIGVVTKIFNNFTFRYNYYQFSLDKFRAVCEVIFVFFYVFYFLADLITVYYQIKHSKIIIEKSYSNDRLGLPSEIKKNRCYLFLYQICHGVWKHFTKLGNLINLFSNIIGFFIILFWLLYINNSDIFSTLKNIDYKKLEQGKADIEYFHNFNRKLESQKELQNIGYYYLVGAFLFFQIMKLIFDFMRFFEIGNFYVFLIRNVFKKVILFLLFLFIFFATFAIFLKNIFGLSIGVLSDGYTAGLYLFQILLSNDSQIEAMWKAAPLITTFFYIIYFLLIVFILINVFLVITKNEFLTNDQVLQEARARKTPIKKNPFDYKLCIIAKLKILYRNFKLLLLKCFNRKKYDSWKKELEDFQEQIDKESNIFSEIDFNTEFKNFLSESNKSNKTETDVERFSRKKDKMKKFVIFIWRTLVMTITFVIFSVLIVYYFDSSTNFSVINNVRNKVALTPSPPEPSDFVYSNILEIKSRFQSLNFLENIFPSYFSKFIYIDDINSTTENNSINYAILNNVYLVNNLIRLTIRKRKFEPIPSLLTTLFPYSILPTFSRNAQKNDFENTTDVFIPQLNKTIHYIPEESYQNLGGYVIYEQPSNDSFNKLIVGLRESGFLDMGLNSIIVDFILVSFQEKGRFLKTNIYFEVDDSGKIETNVYVMSFFRNAKEGVYDVLILTTIALISIFYLLFFAKSLRDVFSRKHNYDTWYTLYIRNRLPSVLLYHREMKSAEILRKIKFIFNYRIMINFSFLLFGGGFLIAVGIYDLKIFFFEANAMIFNKSVKNFIYEQVFLTPNSNSDIISHYGSEMNKTSQIVITNAFVLFFATCTAFVLTAKIIFYYSKNENFNLIIQTLRLAFMDFLLILIIFLAILIAFVVCTYFSFGVQYSDFNSFDACYYNLLVPMVYFENLGVNYSGEDKVIFLMLVLPFFITFRLVWLNLIISILFKHFKLFHDKKIKIDDENKFKLSFKDFFYISLDLLRIMKKKHTININQRKNQEIILQTLEKVNVHLPFISMKNSVKNSDRLKNVNVWADVCSEEIKYEYDSRKFLKDKCDEIIKNIMNSADEFGEDANYLQLNQITFKRVPIEFELRKVFWEYFRIAHLYLHRYDYYLQHKIDEIMKIRKLKELKNELNKLHIEKKGSKKISKKDKNENEALENLTNKEIVLKLEENIKIIKQLKEEENYLNNLLFKTDTT